MHISEICNIFSSNEDGVGRGMKGHLEFFLQKFIHFAKTSGVRTIMTLITVTQPYALQAEGWVCRQYPPEIQCSDSSGGGSPQSPVTRLKRNAF